MRFTNWGKNVKTARGNKRILGRCPDFMVMGRSLREWAEGSLGESPADLFALREATCKATGMDFEEAVGPTMAEEWSRQLAKLRQAEEDADLFGPYREGLRILGHPEAKLGCLFKLSQPKDGLPEAFAAASSDGRVFAIGLVDGSWRELDLMAAIEAITSANAKC